MNYYGILYVDDRYTENVKKYISIVEGIYQKGEKNMVRDVGCLHMTDNKFCKIMKSPYTVIDIQEPIITLKKINYHIDTGKITYDKKYTLLSHLLAAEGYGQERISHLLKAIHTISNNTSIKRTKSYEVNLIDLD
jgi:hypothetical protein